MGWTGLMLLCATAVRVLSERSARVADDFSCSYTACFNDRYTGGSLYGCTTECKMDGSVVYHGICDNVDAVFGDLYSMDDITPQVSSVLRVAVRYYISGYIVKPLLAMHEKESSIDRHEIYGNLHCQRSNRAIVTGHLSVEGDVFGKFLFSWNLTHNVNLTDSSWMGTDHHNLLLQKMNVKTYYDTVFMTFLCIRVLNSNVMKTTMIKKDYPGKCKKQKLLSEWKELWNDWNKYDEIGGEAGELSYIIDTDESDLTAKADQRTTGVVVLSSGVAMFLFMITVFVVKCRHHFSRDMRSSRGSFMHYV
ncbi:GP37 [Caviid betaherpesvirus 2]|uniref:GP37 n=2 Tax=Caviid betaherpesvirus 2 TaxID=33706 RepID=B7TPV6_GPCMV|nr:GP37 [Caviid betaherpesvirus 2]AGE11514.1 GP37 [Caviid betaherpesvirus 2]AIL83902.1 GP37 [BAC cloning vector GPN13BACdenovo_preserved(MM)]BAJ78504.1 GP37 [Caviid betaherpesvirus 2]